MISDNDCTRTIDPRICTDTDLAIDELSNQIDFALEFFVFHHAGDINALMTGTHRALKPNRKLLIVEPAHHASPGYCETIEKAAHQAGLSVSGHPKIIRTWSVLLAKV